MYKKVKLEHQSRQIFYGYFVAAAALALIVLDYGTRLTIGVFFKPIVNEFGWSRALVSGAVTLSMLGQGAGAIFMGRLNDKFGPRFVMTLCGFLIGAGYLLMAVIHSVWQLYVFYGIVVGLGMSGVFTSLLSTTTKWFVKRKGLMAGIVSAGTGLGQLIAPPLANWLISIYDWRFSYIIIGGVVLITGIVLAQVLRSNPSQTSMVSDGNSSELKEARSSTTEKVESVRKVIHTRHYWLLVIIFFSLGYSLMSINTHLVPYITDVGISAATAANIYALCGLFTAIGCVALGITSDKLGNRISLIVYFFVIVISLIWVTQVNTFWPFVLFAIFFGLSSGGSIPIESTIIVDLFGVKFHGSILGTIIFGFACGGALGPFLSGYLFDLNDNYHLAFLVCALLGIIAVISCGLIKPVSNLSSKDRSSGN